MTLTDPSLDIHALLETFDAIIRQHSASLHRHAARRLGESAASDVDDVVQDALLAAWKSLPRFAARSSLSTWLHGVVSNIARKRRSRSSGSRLVPFSAYFEGSTLDTIAEPAAHDGAAESRAIRNESRSRIARGLRALDRVDRKVLVLRDLRNLDSFEAATRLGITEANARVRLHRARARMLPGAKKVKRTPSAA